VPEGFFFIFVAVIVSGKATHQIKSSVVNFEPKQVKLVIYNRAIFLLHTSNGKTARVKFQHKSVRSIQVAFVLIRFFVLERTTGKCLVKQICNQNWHAAAHYNKSFRIVHRGSEFSQQKCF